jgi:Xaa-Pro aminopeptidase
VANVRYLSGFKGSSGAVLVAQGKNFFITDFRYQEEAGRELAAGLWELFIEKGDRLRTIKKLISELGIRTLGVESGVSYEFFQGLSRCGASLRPLTGSVESLRAIKDDGEICSIRDAVRRAEEAFLDVKPYIRPGRREQEIALMLEARLKKRGCNRLPFDIIVASGVNSAMPHAKAGDKKLSPGEFVVIDWGGEAEGYYSDMTRTFLLRGAGYGGGKAGVDFSREKGIYRTVFQANRKAVSSVVPGCKSKGIDEVARNIITNAGYGKFFGHGTGHGVGLEVHESPRITWTRSVPIRENMIFTVEPGIYIPGLGGVRIEDMVRVKPGGAEVLTRLPRDLEIL